jgi:hypothetical protein
LLLLNTRISFGTPVAVDAPDHDTEMEVDGIPGRGYYGSAIVMYSRVSLTTLADIVNISSLQPFTLQTIVSMLNAQFDTFLDVTDLETPTIPVLAEGDSEVITLVAAADSPGWKDQVDITITYGKPALNSIIGGDRLNTLADPLQGFDNLPGYINAVNQLYYIDFTSMRDSLKVVTITPFWPIMSGQGFADYATLSDVCIKLGIPWFPNAGWQNQVADYATSQVPGSNQDFDRVVVMSYVPPGSVFFPGPLYFHYNQFDKA